MKGKDFIFDSVQLMYYKCHKVNFKHGGSHIDSPNWRKNKKESINLKIEGHKSFQQAATVALNYGKIKCNQERVSNIKSFINKYTWEGINYPLKIGDWKTFEKNNLNKYCQVIFQNITQPVKTNNSPNDPKPRIRRMALSCSKKRLLHRKTSKQRVIFIVGIVLIILEQKISLSLMKKYVRIKRFSWNSNAKKKKILEFNQCMKSDKMPYIIYVDIESLISKIDGCANNLEKSSTIKIGEHIPCRYSMSKLWRFDHIENKHTLYHGKNCMKSFVIL